MKIVLNAILAKPEGMGGFNVARNFYFKTLEDKENEWFYFVSREFDAVIKGREKGLDEKNYFVFYSQPDIRHYFKDRPLIKQAETEINPDVIYSILAPSYHHFKTVEVMRCANAWTVVGGVNKYALEVTPLKFRIRYLLKARLTRWLMRNTQYFVTQSEIAKNCILHTVHTSPENVCVVSNVLPEVYQRMNPEKTPHHGFEMVYASSPAVHKDYLILPRVASILRDKYGMKDFRIHVTLPESTSQLPLFMASLKEYGVEDCFVNHGYQNQEDLSRIFSQCDLGLFPSLLETFSVTLLEYMYFNLPIVASDLDFNKEVAGDAAVYFNPHDEDDFASVIFRVFSDPCLREVLLHNAESKLARYLNNSDKYKETTRFLRHVAETAQKN